MDPITKAMLRKMRLRNFYFKKLLGCLVDEVEANRVEFCKAFKGTLYAFWTKKLMSSVFSEF